MKTMQVYCSNAVGSYATVWSTWMWNCGVWLLALLRL